MDVSIIIVNYNTCRLLEQCILSLIEKTRELTYEIIVIDNASVDGSGIMLKENFPDVALIESSQNIGFGRANNLGAKYAKGKYLFLLNTDTLLINNAIKILFDFMEENCTVGVCGGNLFHEDGTPNFSYCMHFPSLLSVLLYRYRLTGMIPFRNEYFNKGATPKEVAIIIGADYFINKSLFDELNGFDPEFFMYIEDGDLSYRVKKYKIKKIFSVPEAKIIHMQGKSSNNDQKYLMETKSYYLYFKKFYNNVYVSVYLFFEIFYCIIRMFIFLILFKFGRMLATFHILKSLLTTFK